MTAVDLLGRVDELPDGTGGSVDAVTGTAIGPCRKSRTKTPGRSVYPWIVTQRYVVGKAL